MDLSDQNKYGDCYCSRWGKYYDPDSSGCSYNDCESDGQEHGGGCYLTTAMCNVLGKEDDCYELNTLRVFREKYMRNDEEGKKLLKEYDRISPPIASRLLSSERKEEIASNMLKTFINIAIEKINGGNNIEAINIYKNMVVYVKEELQV